MTIHEKLVAIQSNLKAPKSQTNTFGKYKYRSCEDILEAVKPLLKDHGLVLTISDDVVAVGHFCPDSGARIYVKAIAKLSDGDNSIESTAYAREAETKKGMDEAQITGSASSYARKYALNGLFCIDDTKDSDATNDHGKAPSKFDSATEDQLSKIKQLASDLDTDVQTIYNHMTAGQVPNQAQATSMIQTLKAKLSKKLDSTAS